MNRRKDTRDNDLRIESTAPAQHLPTVYPDLPTDLAEVIASWSSLDGSTRASVMKLIRTEPD